MVEFGSKNRLYIYETVFEFQNRQIQRNVAKNQGKRLMRDAYVDNR